MSTVAHPRILVACIGNIFLGDDGFGSAVARALAREPLPADAKIVDYGIRGLDLTYALLEPYESIIFVDAIARGGTPGTVYLLQPTEDSASMAAALDPHSMHPACLLALARSLGEITAAISIVGCEPADFGDELEGRMGLSPPVAAAVPHAVAAVRELIVRGRANEVHTAAAACSA